jgi:serine/threonine protein kinase
VSISESAVRHLRGVLATPVVPDGRYVIGPVVGEGGMGTVYRAHDRRLDRAVAVKVLRPDLAGPDAARRLRREAGILARLEHPGIVPVHDVGTLADGRVFYVMKLVEGKPLGVFAGTTGLTNTLRLFLRVAETVSFAHARGVVHRDLKPANIMVGSFGEVVVLDWGIARLIGRPSHALVEGGGGIDGVEAEGAEAGGADRAETAEGGDFGTGPGTVLGTPGFMAPEQSGGESDRIGPATDVFALGVMLRGLVQAAGPADRSLRPLASIWSRATQTEPDRRYPSAAQLGDEIARFLDGRPVRAHRESVAERLERWFRRYQTAIVLILTYLSIRLLFLVLRGL